MRANQERPSAYTKELKVKLVRTKHKVCLWAGQSVKTLKESLSKVPDDAEIDEAYTDEDGEITTIQFHHESVEKE